MPSDVFIALDPGGEFFQPFLFNYNGNLYQLIPSQASYPTPGPIQMWKSTNSGATWTVLSSTVLSQRPEGVAACLLGTKLYLFYPNSSTSSASGELAYFDFTTDSFTLVTTTGTVPQPDNSILAGPDPNHLYVINFTVIGGAHLIIGELVSNAYSSIGSLPEVLGADGMCANSMLLGASGILHILYTTSPFAVQTSPSSLAYCNVQSGVLVGTTSSTVVISSFSDGFPFGYPGLYSQPIQIGSNILLAYYDPTAQAVKLLSFDDVGTPTFTTSVIDASFSVATGIPTGAFTIVLGLVGSTGSDGGGAAAAIRPGAAPRLTSATALYCFYTNFSGAYEPLPNNGDGWLYYKTSTDGGATWSPRKQAVQHIDPTDLTPLPILIPEIGQPVGSTTLGKIPISYRTNTANAEGQYLYGRFYFGLSFAGSKNYVF
jgi:hypothetical protein